MLVRLENLLCLATAVTSALAAPTNASQSLPVVKLDYTYHQAISFNETGGWYNFSNIRFGQAPIGDLRFRAPLTPLPANNTCKIDNGSIGRVCPQALGNWTLISQVYTKQYLAGNASFNNTAAQAALPKTLPGVSLDPRTTEDCLFLDVIAPAAGLSAGTTAKLPVLVWIYGGGYSSGEKTGYGDFDPAGLLRRANNSFVFVAPNYRLGALGWLGGKQVAADGTPNAGLYDQRLALQWVQKNIHLFGGDASRVTVMGASAGAGSIMHQLTAFGGQGSRELFSQAIMESPAFLPSPAAAPLPDNYFAALLQAANASSLAQLRALPSERLIAANARIIYSGASYGSNIFGPYVDGLISTQLPGVLLSQGRFQPGTPVLLSHNSDEGLIFTNPLQQSDQAYLALLHSSLPTLDQAGLATVSQKLYPAVFDGSYGYTSQFQRAVVTIADVNIVCNTRYLSSAISDKAVGLRFSIPPGTHGEETPYVFQNGLTENVVPRAADSFQECIVSFVTGGQVRGLNGTALPLYGADAIITNLTTTGDVLIRDDAANDRCAFWQTAL